MTPTCKGTILSLRDEVVTFTGTLIVNGQRVKRDVITTLAQELGAEVVTDSSRRVTVLVLGESWTGPLHDERRRYSKKATFVEKVERAKGGHVHVIDAVGFGELLRGGSARCYRLRAPST